MKIRLNVTIAVPGERVREFNLEYAGPQVLIGRDSENDIQIPLQSVSRKHARIYEENGHWFVEDTGSASGTRVNGERLLANAPRELGDADVIQVVHASITTFVSREDKLETDLDDKTAVVAQRMVRDILDNSKQNDPYLVVLNGRHEGLKAIIPANAEQFVIGRADNADLVIEDVSLSRRHVRLTREWESVFVEDLGSKNGVVVNGRKLTGLTRIKDGDHIYLGALHLAFMDPLAVATAVTSATELSNETEPSTGTHTKTPSPTLNNRPLPVPKLKVVGVFEIALGVLACAVLGGLIAAVTMWFS